MSSLQTAYYIIGIISMIIFILFAVAMVVGLFIIRTKINQIQETIDHYTGSVKQAINHPKDVATNIGIAVADTALKKVKQSKRRRRRT